MQPAKSLLRLANMRHWIVYTTPGGKTEAVEDDYHDRAHELRAEKNVVVGYVSFNLKQDAIDYADQVLLS